MSRVIKIVKSGTEVGTDVACNTKEKATSETKISDNGKKYRGYLLTINNFTPEMEEKLKGDDYQYLCYQVEKGESGTEHIQAYLYYKNPRVWPKRKFPTAHIEPCRSFAASKKYCQKEETRVRGPYEFGTEPKQGNRSDLDEIAQKVINGSDLKSIAMQEPEIFVKYNKGLQALAYICAEQRNEKPTVIWIWGKAGVGKTRWVIDKHGAENVYIKDGTQWWDGYRNQEAILVDDFDGRWPYRDFLRFLDRYAYQGQYKGGYCAINSPYIYITCEFHPKDVFKVLNDDADQENHLDQVLRRIEEKGRIIHKTGAKNFKCPKPIEEEIE